jgi:hypothetical protein
VTTLTLSSQTKATLFGIMLWRCWASSEHGIARLGTYDLRVRGYAKSGLKLGWCAEMLPLPIRFHCVLSERFAPSKTTNGSCSTATCRSKRWPNRLLPQVPSIRGRSRAPPSRLHAIHCAVERHGCQTLGRTVALATYFAFLMMQCCQIIIKCRDPLYPEADDAWDRGQSERRPGAPAWYRRSREGVPRGIRGHDDHSRALMLTVLGRLAEFERELSGATQVAAATGADRSPT